MVDVATALASEWTLLEIGAQPLPRTRMAGKSINAFPAKRARATTSVPTNAPPRA